MSVTGATACEPPDLEEVRAAFPQLEVLSLIGAGGMGAVFKARQPQLDRLVALKLLAFDQAEDPRFAERFQREAQALARLSHPHIVTIHDFGKAGRFYYLLMEYVDGVNLRQATGAGRLTPEQALAIVPPICDALQYAHERGIVHRDIKPENLLLDRDGRLKIADFGIARMLGITEPRPAEAPAPGDLTQADALGTPAYMAPEQKDAPQRVDRRADIYSLGVVFYEMLTGELPVEPWMPPSRKVQIDVRLDEIVLRALEKSPELRFQTAEEMRTQVETVASVPPPRESASSAERVQSVPAEPSDWRRAWLAQPESRRRWILGGVALLALILFACFAWPQRQLVRSSSGAVMAEIQAFGYPEPWLKEIHQYAQGGHQKWPEQRVAIPSFAAGVLGVGAWIALVLLVAAEVRSGFLRGNPADPAVRLPRRFGAAAFLLALAALAHWALLVCAVIPVPPLLNIAMTILVAGPVAFLVVWRALHGGVSGRASSGAGPRGWWQPVLGATIGLMILGAIAAFIRVRQIASAPPPPPLQAEPAEWIEGGMPGMGSGRPAGGSPTPTTPGGIPGWSEPSPGVGSGLGMPGGALLGGGGIPGSVGLGGVGAPPPAPSIAGIPGMGNVDATGGGALTVTPGISGMPALGAGGGAGLNPGAMMAPGSGAPRLGTGGAASGLTPPIGTNPSTGSLAGASPATGGGAPGAIPSGSAMAAGGIQSSAALVSAFEQKLAEARARADAGLITQIEVKRAERDLAVAKAGNDAAAVARAELAWAEAWHSHVKIVYEVGVASRNELRDAELELAKARAKLESATGGAPEKPQFDR